MAMDATLRHSCCRPLPSVQNHRVLGLDGSVESALQCQAWGLGLWGREVAAGDSLTKDLAALRSGDTAGRCFHADQRCPAIHLEPTVTGDPWMIDAAPIGLRPEHFHLWIGHGPPCTRELCRCRPAQFRASPRTRRWKATGEADIFLRGCALPSPGLAILKKLLAGPIQFTPVREAGERYYTFRAIALDRLIAGTIGATMVASPNGLDPLLDPCFLSGFANRAAA